MAREIVTTAEKLHLAYLDAGSNPETGEDLSLYPILAELEDHDVLPGELGEVTDGNGLVTMLNSVELSLALQVASDGLGFTNTTSGILEKVEHEREHADAAQALGLTAIHAVRFKLLRSGNIGMKVTTIPVGGPVTKLGFASILAHPRRLSQSDIRKIQAIGYHDAANVAYRIDEAEDRLPRPLSTI